MKDVKVRDKVFSLFITAEEIDKAVEKVAEMIKAYSEFFETEAQKYEMKTFLMDGNFEKEMPKVFQFFES